MSAAFNAVSARQMDNAAPPGEWGSVAEEIRKMKKALPREGRAVKPEKENGHLHHGAALPAPSVGSEFLHHPSCNRPGFVAYVKIVYPDHRDDLLGR